MRIRTFAIIGIVAAVAAAVVLSTCGRNDDGYPDPDPNPGDHTVSTNSTNRFSPETLTVDVGDVIAFNVGAGHTATQVTQATWDTNGATPLPGGFDFQPGTHTYTVRSADEGATLWYVCQNHASMGMKGRIVVRGPATHTVSVAGLVFSPATVSAKVGDKVTFVLTGTHTATQVEQAVWEAGGTTQKQGGFRFTAGSETYTLKASDVGTLYYVCEPHVGAGMKGTIVVTAD